MANRDSKPVRYLEDFAVGQKYRSARVTMSATEIKAFANAFDPQPFHLNEEAARASFFGGLAATGGTPQR